MLTSYVIREIQNKTDNTKCSEECRRLNTSYIAGGNEKHAATLENRVSVSYKLKNVLTI